ncbi:hypothetical protein B0H63DRAFT_498210 [Podospora didyma]|uniref:Uncharacterized protein n=1 Tax=Podospora didyma TaxID=330526 RepID=A0AAE0N1B7_9PEZI|nr:hypothetical protein B0H63DRAFT_498210 [Podospora didyma]
MVVQSAYTARKKLKEIQTMVDFADCKAVDEKAFSSSTPTGTVGIGTTDGSTEDTADGEALANDWADEQSLEVERQRAENERQRADEAVAQTQHTILAEYVAACHDLVFSKPNIQRNKKFTTKGSTNPRGKCVEDPVRVIMDQLKRVDELKSAFDAGDGVVFENHPHAISENSEEVVDAEAQSAPQTPGQHHRRRLRPDQICVYRSYASTGPAETRTIIYVSEYKPPHKLTAPHLRLSLQVRDIPREVINRATIPTDSDSPDKFQYHAERLTASAVAQTYHYMIEAGLEYGLLTTGEAIVFLKVGWEEPETLYYHLAEPGPEGGFAARRLRPR